MRHPRPSASPDPHNLLALLIRQLGDIIKGIRELKNMDPADRFNNREQGKIYDQLIGYLPFLITARDDVQHITATFKTRNDAIALGRPVKKPSEQFKRNLEKRLDRITDFLEEPAAFATEILKSNAQDDLQVGVHKNLTKIQNAERTYIAAREKIESAYGRGGGLGA